MRQITLDLRDQNDQPPLMLEPDREQQIIALMVQVILAVAQNHEGKDHESE